MAKICLAKTDGEVGSLLASHKLISFCMKRIALVEESTVNREALSSLIFPSDVLSVSEPSLS